jgi:hypothetical protein
MDVVQNSSGSTDTPPSIRAETQNSPEPDMRAPTQELVKDRIFNYRLTKEIVEGALLKMFPALSTAALDVRVSDYLDVESRQRMYANDVIGRGRCFYVLCAAYVDFCEW